MLAVSLPWPLLVCVILSIAKNLSIHGMRYFTTLRSVQYDSVRVVCVILSIAKNLSIHGIRYFTALRSVQYDSVRVVCVILSIAKNLSIHGMRYFTTLRSVQYDSVRVVCHFNARSEIKNAAKVVRISLIRYAANKDSATL